MEVSTDGQTWTKVTQLASNFNELHNLRERTVFLIQVDNPNQTPYTYARISSNDGSAISIAVFDLYTAKDPVEVPSNILKGWDNDPYIAIKAPAQSEEDTTEDTTEITSEVTTDTQSEQPSEEKKSGCGSVISSMTALPIMFIAVGAFAIKKRKTK